MSEKEQKQWYVIRAIGGKEKKVKEYIETEVHNNHLEDFISQVLIPTEKVYQIKNGKKISRDRKSTRLNSSHTDSSRMPSSA